MIDLHSHILAGIDDGAKELADSLAMAEQAVEVGVTHMVCTPHIHQGYFDNDSTTIESAFNDLVESLQQASCPLSIAFASEVRITPEIMVWVKTNKIPFLGTWQGKNVLLLELPHSHIPAGTDNLLRWLSKNNVQVVIAHPERNRDIIADYNKIMMLKRVGCLFQVTAGSFTGRFNDAVKSTALKMLDDDIVSYIASDTHSLDRRPNDMGEARHLLTELVGTEKANSLTLDIPSQITQNQKWR